MKLSVLAAAIAALSLGGCATIVNDSTQPLRLETQAASGQAVAGAECKLSNDYGSTTVKSGDTTQVRRSSRDMDITCTSPGQPEAKARAVSRANAGMAGNIIFGGAIGAVIDHSKGTAYTYPTWIQMVFGQTLVFDRQLEKHGAPVPGLKPEEVAQALHNRAASSNPGSPGCSHGQPPCPPVR